MIEPKQLLASMTDGKEDVFLSGYWRKRTVVARGCLPQFDRYYTAVQFLDDYRRVDYHNATYLISIDDNGNREMRIPPNWRTIESALNQRASMALLARNLPDQVVQFPTQWKFFLSFHESLCNYLCGDFPAPPRDQSHDYFAVASVDFFYTPRSVQISTGGHYDTGDVFYFVLEGEKEWTVELGPDYETTNSLVSQPGGRSNLTNADRSPSRECMVVDLAPGDCIYVPPYTYHRVCSNDCTLGVSLGLPTFDEVTLFAQFLTKLRLDRGLYEPLPCFPSTQKELRAKADEETRSRMMGLLAALGRL